jgi:hypothetical protein
MSKSFDKKSSFDHEDQLNVVSIIPTEHGPAILSRMRLCDIISVDPQHWDRGINQSIASGTNFVSQISDDLNVNVAALCMRVADNAFIKDGDLEFVDEVEILNVVSLGGSCNPGSHISVPCAPYLTALLQFSQADKDYDFDGQDKVIPFHPYLSPEEAAALFPRVDFSRNKRIDKFIASCSVNSGYSYFRTSGGLKEWSAPYLKKLRDNRITPLSEEEYNGLVRKDSIPSVESQKDGSSNSKGSNGTGADREVCGQANSNNQSHSQGVGETGFGTLVG